MNMLSLHSYCENWGDPDCHPEVSKWASACFFFESNLVQLGIMRRLKKATKMS